MELNNNYNANTSSMDLDENNKYNTMDMKQNIYTNMPTTNGDEAAKEVVRNIRHIKKIQYSGPLFRADSNEIKSGISASVVPSYVDAPIKYFTLHPEELHTYFKTRDYTYKTTWYAKDLVLVDLFHLPTRTFLYSSPVFSDEDRMAFDTAFPLDRMGRVYWKSKPKSAHLDYVLLNALCRVGGFDGYYMETQQSRRNGGVKPFPGFHSEVGLCSKAFSKLTCIDSKQEVGQTLVNRNMSSAKMLRFNGGKHTTRRQKRKQRKQRKTRKV